MARRQQEKSAQTQQELMDAAMELFVEKGFVATTVQEITDKAGYAKGNFYRYWSSKDELMLEIVAAKMREYRAMRDARLGQAQSLMEVMAGIVEFLHMMHQDHQWSLVFLEFTIYAARKPDLRARLHDAHYRLSNDIFAALVGPFVPPQVDARRMGAINTALFEGFLIHELLGSGTLQWTDFQRAAMQLAMEAAAIPEENRGVSSVSPLVEAPQSHKEES
jgi:AcrR family transcriptional regulator